MASSSSSFGASEASGVPNKQALAIPASFQSELWFLVSRWLESDPATSPVAEQLRHALESGGLLPQRYDWTGKAHPTTFQHLAEGMGPVAPEGLLSLLYGLCGSRAQKATSQGPQLRSLMLQMRNQSESNTGPLRTTVLSAINQRSLGLALHSARFSSGDRRPPVRTCYESIISRMKLQRRTYGHVDPTYCLLFDRTGQFVFTGADDFLVKCWRLSDARLIYTFRGSSAQISDITISHDNQLLAAGSCDKVIRVWCLLTATPIAVLTKHTGDISAVSFCPLVGSHGQRYLASTSRDGSVAFWRYRYNGHGVAVFEELPTRFHEKLRPGRAQLLCASFSAGGVFYAVGSADHHVRIYQMNHSEGPTRILEEEAHDDRVDSILWCNKAELRFVSGSKDGTARIWRFRNKRWTSICLNMLTGDNREREQVTVPSFPVPPPVASSSSSSRQQQQQQRQQQQGSAPVNKSDSVQVFMLSWTIDDSLVLTAAADTTIKIWNSYTGVLQSQLRGHEHDIFVLEPHPVLPNLLLSSAFDGYFIVWDLETGKSIFQYRNSLESPTRNIAVHDAKWSPDGFTICACDNEGHLLILGNGENEHYELLPLDLFFDSDYSPLLRDQFHNVVDEQTQVPPHLLPPPFLIDRHRNPYPARLQKLVPGREQLSESEAAVPGAIEQNYFAAGGAEAAAEVVAAAAAPAEDEEPGPSRDPLAEYDENSSSSHASASTVAQKILRNDIKKRQLIIDTSIEKGEASSQMENQLFRMENSRIALTLDNDSSVAKVSSKKKAPKSSRGRGAVAEEEEDGGGEDEEVAGGERGDEDTSDCSLDESDFTSSEESSEENFSDQHSDWGSDNPQNPQDSSPKGDARPAKVSLPATNGEPSSSLPSKHKKKSPKKRSAAKKCRQKMLQTPSELESYIPSPWLSESMPKKTPYFPQMHDTLMYFKQGHERYCELVKSREVYTLRMQEHDWLQRRSLGEVLLVKVEKIKFEIRPPRLAVLKLSILNQNSGKPTGESFCIKYHDMNDVVDFLVLHETYKSSANRAWKHGDRIRCMIDDCWWKGTVQKVVHHDANKRSPFLSIYCHWDNGEKENLSPWDIEGLDSDTADIPDGTAVSAEQLKAASFYSPADEEWNDIGREVECRRIAEALETVMSLAIAEPFNYPVDLSTYSEYMLEVSYPMDLNLIKTRLENRFYRRLTALKFDVEVIARNAAKFNQPRSLIVKNASIISKLILLMINDAQKGSKEVTATYHSLQENFAWPSEDEENEDSEDEVEEAEVEENKEEEVRSKEALQSRSPPNLNPKKWKHDCSILLSEMAGLDIGEPFRIPVSEIDYPDYNRKITTPMDLSSVKEYLMTGQYDSPIEFKEDVMLIFQNSREYNSDRKSEIREMTERLFEWFDTHFHPIVSEWRKTNRRLKMAKGSPVKGKGKGKGKGASNRNTVRRNTSYASDSEEESSSRRYQVKGKGVGKGASNRLRTRKTTTALSDESDEESGEEGTMRIRASSSLPSQTRQVSSRTLKPPARYRDEEDSDEQPIAASTHRTRRGRSSATSDQSPSAGTSLLLESRRSSRARKPLRNSSYQYEEDSGDGRASGGRRRRNLKRPAAPDSRTHASKRPRNESDSSSSDDDDDVPLMTKKLATAKQNPPPPPLVSNDSSTSTSDDDKPLARAGSSTLTKKKPESSQLEKEKSLGRKKKDTSESEFEQKELEESEESSDQGESEVASVEDADFLDDEDSDHMMLKQSSSSSSRKRPRRTVTLQPKANSSKRAAQALDSESEHTSARRPSRNNVNIRSEERRRRSRRPQTYDDSEEEEESLSDEEDSDSMLRKKRPMRAAVREGSRRRRFKEDNDSDNSDRDERRSRRRPNPKIL